MLSSSCLLSTVARLNQQVDNAIAVVTLDDDLAILGRATHATALLEILAQCLEVVATPNKASHNSGNTATLEPIEPHAKVLLRGGEGSDLLLLFGGILIVGVGGEHHAQSCLPIVLCHNAQKKVLLISTKI